MKPLIILSISFFFLACQNSVDLEKEEEKIKAQMDLIADAHWQKDAHQFFAPNAKSWVDIRNGKITEVNKADVIAPTQAYLDDMDFHEMNQRSDPVIEITEDGTMASYAGAITLKGMLREIPVYWPVSWLSVLRKIDGEWKIISSANTEADESTTAHILFNQIRKSLGVTDKSQARSIYALAECTGPLKSFRTLVLSRETDGKLEQIYDDNHIILKHGVDTSWSYNLNDDLLKSEIDEMTSSSIEGHELHWLSLWPEQRYSNAIFKGITEFNAQTAFHISMKNRLQQTTDFYYSFETYFPLGFVSSLSGKPEDTLTVHFEDWGKEDGVNLFKKAIMTHREEQFEYVFVDIKLNQMMDEDFDTKEALIQ